ncbi:hypothetical protein [Arcobacter sp. FWKO B]|uniref:hypothetical protein n=1 Tax=Arcobacter sp. FWKO B TaxID=2593672 RepID=UPI0018A3586F|nr:hypothetical protein [Arcobacter sp. FWKO B]QOG13034.1 hypothetical protein FWKOB_10190 [Arcobacter sp. FWKO B]
MHKKIEDFVAKLQKTKKKQSSLEKFIDDIFYLRDKKDCSFEQIQLYLFEVGKIQITRKAVGNFYNLNKEKYQKKSKNLENLSFDTPKKEEQIPVKIEKENSILEDKKDVIDKKNKTKNDILYRENDIEVIQNDSTLSADEKIKKLQKYVDNLENLERKNILHYSEILIIDKAKPVIEKLKAPHVTYYKGSK